MFYTSKDENLIFVAKAVLKKDASRPQLGMIWSTGSEIVATDGHRLHYYKSDLLPVGYYEIKKLTKTTIELLLYAGDDMPDFPDFARIMPDSSKALPFKTHRQSSDQISTVGKYAEIIRAIEVNTIDYKFFEDANTATMCSFYAPDGTSPVLLVGLDVKAVIMPYRYL